jgi:hypothetical protein
MLQPLPITSWKWEDISMDFITGLPKTSRGFDLIWVIMDHLTKLAHFVPVKTNYRASRYTEIYVARIMSLHGIPKTIVTDRGTQFVSQFLTYFEYPVRVLDRKDHVTQSRTIKWYKIQWDQHSEEEATWESEYFLLENFPEFFASI